MFSFRDSVDLWLRIGFGALILLGCYFVMQPFLTAILLAGILAVVSWPLYERALTSFGNRSTIAATFMVCVVIVTVLIPLSIITGVLAHQIPQLIHWVRDWVAGGMKLPDWLIAIPYVGESINEAFHLGFDPAALGDFIQKAIDPVTKWVLSASVGIGNGLFQMALVAFIAFFFYRDGNSLARRGRLFLKRVSGDLADEYTGILVNTTRSVVFGVLGTAVGQGVVAAIGFIIADVPGVVMLSFAVCVLSVVPVGPPLVWGSVAIWLAATDQIGWAVFLVLWGTLAVSSVDNFIKPILISRGTALPLALVFLGVLGGIMSFGMLGVVLGPIFLSAAIAMLKTWLKHPVKRLVPVEVVPGSDAKAAAESEEQVLVEEGDSSEDDKKPASAVQDTPDENRR